MPPGRLRYTVVWAPSIKHPFDIMHSSAYSKKLIARALLILFGILLPAAGLELIMRVQHRNLKVRSHYKRSDNPRIGFVRKPNPYFEINSAGFRDVEHSSEKQADVFRIILLGDSVTSGFKVDFNDRFQKRLESLLSRHSRKYEIVNLGVDQFCTEQEVALFKELGMTMSPDLVILAYVLNDLIPDGLINDFFRRDRADSFVLDWIRTKWKVIHERRNWRGQDYYQMVHKDSDKWRNVSDSFRELGELSHRQGFPVLLVVFPLLDTREHASFEGYKWRAIHQLVMDEAIRNDFKTLDLLPHYGKWKPSDLRVAPNDRLHPNKLGNEIAAKAIYETLLALNIVG